MSFRSVAERMKKRCSVPLVGCPIFKGQFSCRESQILRLNWLSSCWITLGLNWLWLGRSGDLGTEHLLMPCWGLVENEHVCCEVGSCSVLCQDRNICEDLEFKLLLMCDTSDLQDASREEVWTALRELTDKLEAKAASTLERLQSWPVYDALQASWHTALPVGPNQFWLKRSGGKLERCSCSDLMK